MDRIAITFLLVNLAFLVNTGYARDPNVEHEPKYGERHTVGGSAWSGGDTFIAIALPVAVVMLIALPHLFDGKFDRWPVHRFALFHQLVKTPLSVNKFPTRSLCGSY